MRHVSIGIINRDTKDYLDKLLDSIYRCTLRTRFDIVVVDNGSTDGSLEMLRTKYPRVSVLENHINRGFAVPCNQIFERLTSEYVLLVNTDVVVFPGCIDTLYDFMVEHKEAAACGPQLWSGEGKIQPTARKFHGVATILLEVTLPSSPIISFMRLANSWNRTREVDYVSAAFIMIRRIAIDQVGFFDEAFLIYVQEIDWCYRATKSGWKTYYVPAAKAVHYEGVGMRPIAEEAFARMVRERHHFIAKHFGGRKGAALARLLPYAIGFKLITLKFALWFNHRYRHKEHVLRKMYRMWHTSAHPATASDRSPEGIVG